MPVSKKLSLDEMKALYQSTTKLHHNVGMRFDDPKKRFTVRQYDGMDGCWTDLVEAIEVEAEIALAVWVDRTEGGTRCVSYDHIDYYAIFPADTKMFWDGSPGREMHR